MVYGIDNYKEEAEYNAYIERKESFESKIIERLEYYFEYALTDLTEEELNKFNFNSFENEKGEVYLQFKGFNDDGGVKPEFQNKYITHLEKTLKSKSISKERENYLTLVQNRSFDLFLNESFIDLFDYIDAKNNGKLHDLENQYINEFLFEDAVWSYVEVLREYLEKNKYAHFYVIDEVSKNKELKEQLFQNGLVLLNEKKETLSLMKEIDNKIKNSSEENKTKSKITI